MRITRKELKHDALLESASKTTRFIENHMSKVAIAVVAVIVVIVGWNLLLRARRTAELEANALLTQATQTLNSGMFGQAADQLQAIATDYAGTRSAAAATCYLGAVRFREGSFDEALAFFDDYLARYERQGSLYNAALEGRAAVLEQQREFAAAAIAFEQLAQTNQRNPQAYSRHMLSAARCHRSQLDWPAAAAAAKHVLDRYPDTALASQARILMAEANARART